MARLGLIFKPATGLLAPQTEEIREGVAADWVAAFEDPNLPPLDTEPTTPAGQLIDAEVAEIEAKNAEILHLSNMFNPRVSEGRWQDALGYIYFLERKRAEPSVVTCQLSGLQGTSIPYGALAQSASGYTFICNRSVTIGANGTAETTFRCSQYGAVEIAPHSLNTIITTVPGWDSIDNAAAAAVGREEETRSEFEARRAASVAANAHGSTSALYAAIANISGVLDVQVLENIAPEPLIKYGVTVPGHGITICVYGGEDADIAKAIYEKKDNGADTGGNSDIIYNAADYNNAVYKYKILRPATVNFWIKVTLGVGTALSPAIKDAIKDALYLDFYGMNTSSGNSRIKLASTVYASRFYCPALAALENLGLTKNIQSIEIALTENTPESFAELVNIAGNQEPVISTDNILVEVQNA